MKKFFHEAFELGIGLKIVFAVFEILSSILILLVKPNQLNQLINVLTANELKFDPHDFIANQLIAIGHQFASTQWFAAIYLFSHGVIKVFLLISLWQKRLWAYPLAVVVFSGFALYQTYQFILTHSIFMVMLTILDIIVIALTWVEYQSLPKIHEV
jgi:uncharacterized membrane protein